MSDPVNQAPTPEPKHPSVWLSPAGISAIAGVAAAILVVVGWFVAGGFRADPGEASTDSEKPPAENVIFVYGSAMPGEWGYDVIERFVESTHRDEVEGTLFDSGRGYPMAKFELGGTIPGFRLVLDEATLEDAMRALTQFEAGSFAPVEVRTNSGATARAFEWIGSTDGFPRIDAWSDSLVGDFGANFVLTDFFEGECFDVSATAGQGVLINCAAPHQFSVFHVHDLAEDDIGESFPGVPALVAIADAQCTEAFADEFARDPAADELSWHVPTESSWADGARSAVCAVRAS